MTKPIFITLRILIVALTFFVLRWLFLSSPTIVVTASEVHCQPVGWDYLGRNYGDSGFFDIHDSDEMEQFSIANDVKDDLADQRRARNDVISACNLARDNRKLYMNLTAIFAATAFITLPKPTRKKFNLNFLKLKRKDELAVAVPKPQESTLRRSRNGEPKQQDDAG